MKHLSYLKIILVLTVLFTTLYAGTNQDDAYGLYKKAKEHVIDSEWNEAISLFQQLVDKYPDSNYNDDGLFWIGYCLEKLPANQTAAFLAYDRLVHTFPNSTWNDDAVMHQLDLAYQLLKQGQKQYKNFISEQSKSTNKEIAQKATKYLVSGVPAENPEDNNSDAISVRKEAPKKNDDAETAPEHTFLFFPTERYTHYRKMLHNDDNWTMDQLYDFGMWTILKEEQFNEYFALSGFDRKEWFRKFWAMRDPTPTTEKNEALEEFKRRVVYAKAHFGNLVDYKHLKYLRDQDLRQDWFHAPWDARGELYIKYGDPDFTSIAGFREVEWTYSSLNVDFIIEQNMTNIYGNAIKPGPLSQFNYRYFEGQFDADYVYNNEFRYAFNYEKEPLNDAEIKIESKPADQKTVIASYTFPFKEMKKNTDGNIQFLQRYVVYDADMRNVLKKESTENASGGSKSVQKEIHLTLNPGEYMLALRIEDLNSDKLGIFFERFTIEK